MRWWIVVGLCLSNIAAAGTGPWILGDGDSQLYTGLDAQRFRRVAESSGSYSDDVSDLGEGLSAVSARLIGAYGFARRWELEVDIGYGGVFAIDDTADICSALALDACKTTHGVMPIVFRVKGLALDELYGPPVSLAFSLDVRFGQLTAPTRGRLTSLGEGTFDLMPKVSIGRIGGLGQEGSWSLGVDLGWRYRVPLRGDHGNRTGPVPGWEIEANLEQFFTPVPLITFGPAVSWLYRPNGGSFEDIDNTSIDRFAALRVSQLAAGGKVLLRGSDRVTVAMSVFHTLHAVNNPTDTLSVGVGVAIQDPARRRSRE